MPVTLKTTLLKYGQNGEKTGWTYVDIPAELAEILKSGQRSSFRVKGLLDTYPLRQVALIPVGEGAFVLPVNANMRRIIRKEAGAMVQLSLEADDEPLAQSADLLTCLADAPDAHAHFDSLPPGHQRYYTKWIESAKTPQTKAKRIAQAITGFSLKMDYGDMIRYHKNQEK